MTEPSGRPLPTEVGMGLGCMRLSAADGPGEEEVRRIVHAALDAGVTLFDTADVYAPDAEQIGHNEELVARVIGERRGGGSTALIATKGGLRRSGKRWHPDGRARHLRAACEASLRRIGGDRIDLYQLHAPDPRVRWTTSVRALAALHEEGLVERVGLCNVRIGELRQALDLVDVASVQVELNPFDPTAIKGGVVEECLRRGILLLAHTPLGGSGSQRRLERHPTLASIAQSHDARPQQVVLAWLRSLHPLVVPLPGPTRLDTLRSCLDATSLELSADDLADLDAAFPAARILRSPPSRRPHAAAADDDGEVVLLMGYPGAGKSTLAPRFVDHGYQRLNRDERGGSLAALAGELERRLEQGARRVLVDNTYPSRADRFDVVAAARSHGVPVRCVWLQTSLEEAQFNAVERLLDRYGHLPPPEELAELSRRDPQAFAPSAQFRYRRRFEEPDPEEGFAALETVPFERSPPMQRRSERALFLDYDGILCRRGSGDGIELLPGRGERLASAAADGYRLLAVSYEPEVGRGVLREEEAMTRFRGIHDLLGVDIEVAFCPHPPGPAVCWCRKPLPGLALELLRRYPIDRRRSLVVGGGAADRGMAERLGIDYVEAGDFFDARTSR